MVRLSDNWTISIDKTIQKKEEKKLINQIKRKVNTILQRIYVREGVEDQIYYGNKDYKVYNLTTQTIYLIRMS